MADPHPRPSVTLLGGFAAVVGGDPVPDSAWRLRKAKELVKLLALADGRRLHREQAMDILWPDRDPDAAANNLNQAVHAARRALGAAAISAREGLLRLEADLDVEAFERAAADARRERTAAACDRALGLYSGELLPENRYDDWAEPERVRLAALRDELEEILQGLDVVPGKPRLPLRTSTFVGREHELAELGTLIERTRLLTLAGTGGAGKTRLALELARSREDAHAAGAVLVELGPVAEAADVPDAVAEALDLRALPGGALVDAIAAELAPRELLLVLDNCEHVIGSSATLADALLRSAPRLTILATSREPLRVPGEVVFRVPSLAIPDPDAAATPQALLRYESVRLFVDRAGAVAPPRGSPWTRRTQPRWHGSATASTACRWRSSSPPPGSTRSRRKSSRSVSTVGFGSCARGAGALRPGSRRSRPPSTGAMSSSPTPSVFCCVVWRSFPAASGWRRPRM